MGSMNISATESTDWAEFASDWRKQDVEDARLTASKHTGAVYDIVTKDFAAWYNGKVIGYGQSFITAEAIIKEQAMRDYEYDVIVTEVFRGR